MNFGEKNKEKKHEFPMPIPVTPVKIPAAAGRAHEESSKTVVQLETVWTREGKIK